MLFPYPTHCPRSPELVCQLKKDTQTHRHTDTDTQTHTQTHTHTHTHLQTHRQTDTLTHTHTRTHIHTYRHTDTQTHLHTHTHTHTHTHLQTHRHTHTLTHTLTDTQTHRHTHTHIHYHSNLIINSFSIFRHGIRCNAILPGYIETPLSAAVPKSRLDEVSNLCCWCYCVWKTMSQFSFTLCFTSLVCKEDCSGKTRKACRLARYYVQHILCNVVNWIGSTSVVDTWSLQFSNVSLILHDQRLESCVHFWHQTGAVTLPELVLTSQVTRSHAHLV